MKITDILKTERDHITSFICMYTLVGCQRFDQALIILSNHSIVHDVLY